MRDNFHCLYLCADCGWWKRCFHSEKHQLCEHPLNSPGLTGSIWLCLSVSPELMLNLHLKCLFLVSFPLLSKIHHNKGRLTHLWKLMLAHCMFRRCRAVQRPLCIVLSERSVSHRRSLVLLSWIGFCIYIFLSAPILPVSNKALSWPS